MKGRLTVGGQVLTLAAAGACFWFGQEAVARVALAPSILLLCGFVASMAVVAELTQFHD